MLLYVVLVFLSIGKLGMAIGTCHRADTHEAQNTTWTPCNTQTPFSMCSRTGALVNSNPDSACFSNGLALSVDGDGTRSYWREGCTDPTWTSPYCLTAFDVCPNDSSGNAEVTPCEGNGQTSTRWCCGRLNTGCCNGTAIVIEQVLGLSASTSSSITSQNTSSTSTSTSFSTTPSSSVSPTTEAIPSTTSSANSASTQNLNSSSNSTAESGLSSGAKAGIGIGAAAIAASLAFIVLWVIRRRKNRPVLLEPAQESETQERTGHSPVFLQQPPEYRNRAELPDRLKEPHELSTERPPAELGTWQRESES